MTRLRTGEWTALAAAALMLIVLFLPWFDGRIGWTSAGWFMVVLLVLAMSSAVWIAITTIDGTLTRIMPALVIGTTIAALDALVLLLRVALFAPGDREVAAWFAVLIALLLFGGAAYALADERTDAPESAYTPPPARPAP